MPKITIKDGVISSDTYVECGRDYECGCGTSMRLTLQMPEGLEINGQITTNLQCENCGAPVTIPEGLHYVENYELLTRPRQ